MKREDLEALGLSKEQIDKVLDMHHSEYDPVKKDLETAQKDLESEKEKTSAQATTIRGLKNDLEEFNYDDRKRYSEGCKNYKRLHRCRKRDITCIRLQDAAVVTC